MRHNLLLIFLVSFTIVLIPSVSAAQNLYMAQFDFIDQGVLGKNLLNSGVGISTGQVKIGNASFSFSGTSDYARNRTATGFFTGNHDECIGAWIYLGGSVASGDFWFGATYNSSVAAGNDFKGFRYGWENNNYNLNIAGDAVNFATAPPTTAWMHVVFNYTASTKRTDVYKNATLIGSAVMTNTPLMANPVLTMGAESPGNGLPAGSYIGKYWVLNRSCSYTDITRDYNNGAGNALDPDATTNPPNFVSPTPTNYTITTNASTIAVNCSNGNAYLWADATTNPIDLVLANSSTGTWATNFTTTNYYYYKAGCFNQSTSFSANSSVQELTYVKPLPITQLSCIVASTGCYFTTYGSCNYLVHT